MRFSFLVYKQDFNRLRQLKPDLEAEFWYRERKLKDKAVEVTLFPKKAEPAIFQAAKIAEKIKDMARYLELMIEDKTGEVCIIFGLSHDYYDVEVV